MQHTQPSWQLSPGKVGKVCIRTNWPIRPELIAAFPRHTINYLRKMYMIVCVQT